MAVEVTKIEIRSVADASGLGAQRRCHDRLDLVGSIRRFAPTPGGDLPQTLGARLGKPRAPQRYGLNIDPKCIPIVKFGWAAAAASTIRHRSATC